MLTYEQSDAEALEQKPGILIRVTSLENPNNFRFANEDDLDKHLKLIKELEEKFFDESLKEVVADVGELVIYKDASKSRCIRARVIEKLPGEFGRYFTILYAVDHGTNFHTWDKLWEIPIEISSVPVPDIFHKGSLSVFPAEELYSPLLSENKETRPASIWNNHAINYCMRLIIESDFVTFRVEYNRGDLLVGEIKIFQDYYTNNLNSDLLEYGWAMKKEDWYYHIEVDSPLKIPAHSMQNDGHRSGKIHKYCNQNTDNNIDKNNNGAQPNHSSQKLSPKKEGNLSTYFKYLNIQSDQRKS